MSSHDDTLAGPASASEPRRRRAGIGPGDRIGRYLVIGKLGEGGMGVVYSAYDPELDRKVAIKLLHDTGNAAPPSMERAHGKVMHALFGDEVDGASPGASPELSLAQQRLLREAQAAARVNDPSVVTVHDVGQHMGRVFVAMEFVQGRTLSAWIRERPRPWREVLHVMTRAGSGLVAAHAAGLIHRDFKPDNVMLGDDGRVRVMDFGLVRADASEPSGNDQEGLRPTTDALALELTAGGTTMGTPAYMSPEQHLGRPLDGRSDQFSFCVALWEALYGERPFVGQSIASLAAAVVSGEIRSPSTDRDVPAAIHRIVARGLRVDPNERWPSMQELVAAIGRDPLRTRKLAAGGVAIAVLVTGGVVFSRAQRAAAIAQCHDDGLVVDATWNDDARATIRSRIARTAVSYAAASSETIVAALDDHARRWTEATEAVCLAALEPTPSPYPADARSCLDERLAELEGVVATLATIDATSMRGAVAMAGAIAGPDECIDAKAAALRAVQAGDEPPDVLAAARERIRIARRLSALRKFDEAKAALDELAAELPTTSTAVLGWTKLALGHVAERRGDYADAEAQLTEAAFVAEAVGDEPTVLQAASDLVWVVGYRRGKADAAAHWIRWAEALVGRLDATEALVGALLLERLGMLEVQRPETDGGAAKLRQAVEIKRRLLGPKHPEVALVLNSLGNATIARQGPAAARPIWEESLAILEAALGDTHPDLGVPLANLAQVQYRLGDFAAAQALLERAIAVQRPELGADHPEVARLLVNLGTILQTKGDLDAARTVLLEAKRALEKRHGRAHRSLGVLTQQLGKIEVATGNVAGGITILEESLAIMEEVLTPDAIDFASTLSALGAAYERNGDLERAQSYYERALAICMKHGESGDPVQTPVALHQLGNLHRLRGQWAVAVDYLERAVKGLDASQPGSVDNAVARLALAQALWEIPAQRERAREPLAQARRALVEHDARAKLAELDAWLAAHPG